MKIRLLLFASLRERLGKSEMEMEVPAKARPLEVLELLLKSKEESSKILRATLVAINQNYAPHDTPLQEGDELALIPPVAGG